MRVHDHICGVFLIKRADCIKFFVEIFELCDKIDYYDTVRI